MILTLLDLTKKFSSLRGINTAVENINLEVKDREFFVLLGPSGCGKSTLLNLIAGLEKPTYGEILFNDRIVASHDKKIFLTPRERNVAMVFQNYALYPHLNVYENIAFPLRIQKTKESRIKKSVDDVAGILEISDLLNAKPFELSGGQKQRVAIARAIVRRPDIFLLDEPLSNLDAQLRNTTRTELKLLQRNIGITTVYVTHDQTEAMTLGDRIAVLKNGRVEQIGTTLELYNRPSNVFVAAFVGSPPMNLIKTTISEENNNLFVGLGNIKIRVPEDKIKTLKIEKAGELIVGIRPEHILIGRLNKENSVKIKIDSIESLGKEMLFHFTFLSQKLTGLTNHLNLNENELIDVTFSLDKPHFFQKSSS